MLRLRVRPFVALGEVFGSELRDCLRMAPVGSDVNPNLESKCRKSTNQTTASTQLNSARLERQVIPTEIQTYSNRIQWIQCIWKAWAEKEMNICLAAAPLGKIM